jgi:hypothetical protein
METPKNPTLTSIDSRVQDYGYAYHRAVQIRFVHAHELNQGPLVQSTASGAAYLHDVLTHLPYAATSTTW